MKNKLAKILGVVLTTSLIAGMMVIASPASADINKWSEFDIPSTEGNVLVSGLNARFLVQSKDGSLYTVVDDGVNDFIYKSADGGRTWVDTKIDGDTPATKAGAITALSASETSDTVVYVVYSNPEYVTAPGTPPTTARDGLFKPNWCEDDPGVTGGIYISRGGGAFQLHLAANHLVAADVGTFGTREIVVYSQEEWVATGGGTNSRLVRTYYLDSTDAYVTPRLMGVVPLTGVIAIALAPTFGTDGRAYAVNAGGEVFVVTTGAVWTKIAETATGGAYADIAFADDFNAAGPQVFVAVAGEGLWRIAGTTATKITGIDDARISNIDVIGSTSLGTVTVLVGYRNGVVVASVTGSNLTQFNEVELRARARTIAWVLYDKDFASNQKAYVLNVRAGGPPWANAAGSAFNVSIDGGKIFNQWSLINDNISSIISLTAAPNGDLFMLTENSSGAVSLWRTLKVPSTPWERVGFGLNYESLFLSGAYNTDKAVFALTSDASARLQVSTDAANTFKDVTGSTLPAITDPPTAIMAPSATSLVWGDATGKIWYNPNAFIFTSVQVFNSAFTVSDIVSAGGNNLLAVAYSTATTGSTVGKIQVAKSADNGRTWTNVTAVPSGTPAAVRNTDSIAQVTFGGAAPKIAAGRDATGAFTNAIFVATDKGVYRSTSGTAGTGAAGTSNGWVLANSAVTGLAPVGIVTAAGGSSSPETSGMAYAAFNGTTTVARLRGTVNAVEYLAAIEGHYSLVSLQGVSLTAGSVELWAVTACGKVYTYTDTFGVNGSGVTIDRITAYSFRVNWTKFDDATGYIVKWGTTANSVNSVLGGTNVITNTVTSTDDATDATIGSLGNPLESGRTYYVGVWAIYGDRPVAIPSAVPSATAPANDDPGKVASFRFVGTTSVVTALGDLYAPPNLVPIQGAIDVPVVPAFGWEYDPSATQPSGYELQVSKDAGFSTLIGGTKSIAGKVFVWDGAALENLTTYYWRVRAVMTDGTPGPWFTSVFSTVAAEPPTPPTVTNTVTQTAPPPVITVQVPPQNTLTVTQQPAQPPVTITETTTPGLSQALLWVVIAIGSVLCVAVIVLIIRTKRVV